MMEYKNISRLSRRRAPRFHVEIPADLVFADGKRKRASVTITNISPYGVRLKTDDRLSAAQDATLYVPRVQKEYSIHCAWAARDDKQGSYLSGWELIQKPLRLQNFSACIVSGEAIPEKDRRSRDADRFESLHH